jgi:hypothetical protein
VSAGASLLTVAVERVRRRRAVVRGFEGPAPALNAIMLNGLPATGEEFLTELSRSAGGLQAARDTGCSAGAFRAVAVVALGEAVLLGYYLREAEETAGANRAATEAS